MSRTRPSRVLRTALAAAAVLVAAPLLGTPGSGEPAAAAAREKWDTRVFALVPPPGRPAYVHVARSGRVYAGTYEAEASAPGQVDPTPSRVFEWTAGGTLLRSWRVPGQDLTAAHGVQVANETRDGRLVVLETSTRSVLSLDPATGRWRHIARLPDGSVPNYATWGPRGLYVSDYGAGVIWRIDHRGGVHPWLRSPVLDGVAGFGTAGLRYLPGRHAFYLTQQTIGTGDTAPTNGGLYRVPVRADGAPGAPELLWTSQPTDLPDGFGVSRSGHLYVAMAGLTNRVVELDLEGRELDSFPATGTPGSATGGNGSPVPLDTPCSATFLGTRVLVANQSAVQGDATHMALLDVEVGERGRAPYLPADAGFRASAGRSPA